MTPPHAATDVEPDISPQTTLTVSIALWNAFSVAVAGFSLYAVDASGAPMWGVGVAVAVWIPISAYIAEVLASRLQKASQMTAGRTAHYAGAHGARASLFPEDPRFSRDDRRAKRLSTTLRRGSDNKFRGLYLSEETVVAFRGLVPDVIHPTLDVAGFSNALCILFDALASVASVNNGRIDRCTGSMLAVSFSSRNDISDALRTAFYGTRVEVDFEDFEFYLSAGVRRGGVLKGRVGTDMQSWSVVTAGAIEIADTLAAACSAFSTTVLYAGHSSDEHHADYRFTQIDYITFTVGGYSEASPVYAIDEGEGTNADLAVLWLHLQASEMDRGVELLEHIDRQHTGRAVASMKQRVLHAIAASPAEYRMLLGTTTVQMGIPKIQKGALDRTVTAHRFAADQGCRLVFLVLLLSYVPTGKFREAMACFSMAIERASGTVETVSSDRMIARWTVSRSLQECVKCASQVRKIFADWHAGIGMCVGTGDFLQHRGQDFVHSKDRARAECLAMWSYRYKLGVVADADIAVQQRATEVAANTTTNGRGRRTGMLNRDLSDESLQGDKMVWRPVCYDSTFTLPAHIPSSGVCEMVAEVSPVYLRAMGQLADRCWSNARDLFQQYHDTEENDLWAGVLQRACCAALLEEQQGVRNSDEPLSLRIHHAGVEFQLYDSMAEEPIDSQSYYSFNPPAVARHPTLSMSIKPPSVSHAKRLSQSRREERSLTAASDALLSPVTVKTLRDRHLVRRHLGFHGNDNNTSTTAVFGRFEAAEVWNILKLAAILAECLFTPPRMSLGTDSYKTHVIAFLALGCTCDLFFIGDVLLNFYEPLTTDRGIKITQAKEIAKVYLATWFPIDLVASVPWELFWLPFDTLVYAKYPWVRANRLLNVLRLPSQVLVIQATYFPDAHPVAVKVGYHLTMLAFVLYWMGNLWNSVQSDFCPDVREKWVVSGLPGHSLNSSCLEMYFGVPHYDNLPQFQKALIEFHWALRGFAGYGQKWPDTDKQHALCIVNVVMGIGIFATVIAYLQNTMKMTHNEVFLQRLDAVVAVAEHRRLDEKTTADILRYHRMLWAKTKQVYEGQFDDLKLDLPRELVGELAYFANLKAYEKIDLFHKSPDPAFLTRILAKLSLRFGSPGEVLFERGEPAKLRTMGIYFLYKGDARALVDGEIVEVVEEGDFWGEITCLLGVPQPAEFRLLTYCELYFLPMADLKAILEEYPAYASYFTGVATQRRDRVRSILAMATEQSMMSEMCESETEDAPTMFTGSTQNYIQNSICEAIVVHLTYHSTATMSVAELRATQEALHALSVQTQAMRREQLMQCLPQSDEILRSAQRCHAALHLEYQNENNTYTDNFSCCARLFSTKRAVTYFDTHVKQKKEIAHEAGSVATSAHKVNASIRNAKFEERNHWNGGVACVYNPITGQVEWKEKWHHGVAGCWNPVAQRSEWKTNWNGGVAGVFNHTTGCVEWKEKWHHGVGGCWNPNLQCVEWKDKWNHGVCGVWNPLMGCVEWKTNWNGGVAGYFDSAAGRVVWVESWHDGIALVVYDAATSTFVCSSGDCWDWSS